MLAHHLAWLKGHPERSESWLKDRLKDGFDIHHMDGNRDNNSPDNLLLLDRVDHMRVHKADYLAIPKIKLSEIAAKRRNYRKCYGAPIGPSNRWAYLEAHKTAN